MMGTKYKTRRGYLAIAMLLVAATLTIDTAPPAARAAGEMVTTTNLMTNPGFETASSNRVTLRTNLIPNPVLYAYPAGWSVGTHGGATLNAGRSTTGGPAGIANAWYRVDFTSSTQPNWAVSVVAGAVDTALPVVAGRTYTGSLYTRASKSAGDGAYAAIEWLDSAGNFISYTSGPSSHIALNTWERRAASGVAPANAASARILTAFLLGSTSFSSGDYMGATGGLLEESVALGDYFDGYSADSNHFTHAFDGNLHLSTSRKYAYMPETTWTSYGVLVYRSPKAIAGGSAFSVLRNDAVNEDAYAVVGVPAQPGGVQGRTYTAIVSAHADKPTRTYSVSAVQENGGTWRNFPIIPDGTVIGTSVTQFRVTFTTPADMTSNLRFVLRTGRNSGDVIHYDNMMLVEGIWEGDYLDGTTAGGAWTATAHASTSYRQDPAVSAATISQTLNGATSLVSGAGPASLAGDSRSWEYLVKNTGNVELSGVNVAVGSGKSATCPLATLVPKQVMTCTHTGVAGAGLYGVTE